MRTGPTLALTALAIAACAPESGGQDKDRGGLPNPLDRVELASAQAATKSVQSRVIDLSVDQLATKLADGNVRLIDIRTAEEVEQGMISGAEHIAMDAFDPAMLDLSDGREVVLYCRSGRRSRIVGERLAVYTGASAMHLAGGIIAWDAAHQD
ncbi:MAG: rhodanese-like domain-containing protein [Pseudomonadota bacterium]